MLSYDKLIYNAMFLLLNDKGCNITDTKGKINERHNCISICKYEKKVYMNCSQFIKNNTEKSE